MKPTRTAAFGVFAALLIAGLPLASGCSDATAIESGSISVQTTEALDVLPPTVPLVGMVDLAAARQSGSTAALLRGPMSPFGTDSGDLDEFVRMTGFDPATDLDRVYFAGTPDQESGALVVIARFDRDRVERALAEHAEGDFVRSEIDGVPFWSQAGETGGALALPNERMMLAGTEAAVRGMVDRLARGTQGLSADADLVALVQKARGQDAWFVTRGVEAGAGDVMGPLSGVSENLVVSLDFRDAGLGLDAYLAPRPGASAADVADLARGAIAASRARAGAEPELMAMLDGADVREEGAGVRLAMDVPQAVLDQSARTDMRR